MSYIVHPADIEAKLATIWSSFQATNKMRACLFNLIVYAERKERAEYLTAISQKVIEKFPSRVLFITYDASSQASEVKTAVSVLTAEAGAHVIACDLIEIAVSPTTRARIPFMLLPHILPDLPIYVVYGGDPTQESATSRQLERLASRIIFDSEETPDLTSFAQAVVAKKEKQALDVADLNWARIEGWRQLFANVFKSPEELAVLRQASTIKIHFNHRKAPAFQRIHIQSVYLQSWLAAQLGWKLTGYEKKGDELFFSYTANEHTIDVTLVPKHMPRTSLGRPLSVAIQTRANINYLFKRQDNCPDHVLIEKSTPSFCSLPTTFIFEQDVSGKSLVSEICKKGSSWHYVTMLSQLAQLQTQGILL